MKHFIKKQPSPTTSLTRLDRVISAENAFAESNTARKRRAFSESICVKARKPSEHPKQKASGWLQIFSTRLLPAISIAALFFLSTNLLSAQCDLACNGGNPDFPLNIPVNGDCEVELVPEDVLEVPVICPGDKILTVRDEMNIIIVSDTGTVVFDPAPFEGQVLSVTTTDVATGVFCNSFIRAVDISPPVISCVNDTISCISDTSVVALGFPDVVDNCSDEVALSYFDNYTRFTCAMNNSAILERVWSAVDEQGNTSACSQFILLERPDLNTDIEFPSDTLLSCEVGAPTLGITGQPELFGIVIENTSECDLNVTFNDDTLNLCGDIEYRIDRTWTVTETCSGTMATDMQVITVVDTVAPEITCPGPITVATNTGACWSTVNLPQPVVIDNCDPNATFFVTTSYGAVGLGPHTFVPVGTHTIQYTSVDLCGNTQSCTTVLTVEDQERPTAVCEETTIVSLSNNGLGTIFAGSFDGGSNDNCVQELFFKARRMTTGSCNGLNGDDSSVIPGYQEWFDDEVIFCCEEVDSLDIRVIMRVYEVDPGAGPVDPTRELPGGDLFDHFAECMVNVEVQDKIAPVVVCPQNQTIDCTDDYSDLSIFGTATVVDNCSAELTLEETVNIDECSEGTITRTFSAEDPSGNMGGCVQTIQVVNQNPLGPSHIDFPDDYTTNICGAPTDPDDLPDGFDEPVINDPGCSMIGVNYTDELYGVSFPACYKILREWVVLDWCQYDPENPSAGGRFSDVQVIKVEDTDPPVMVCPDDVTVNIGPACGQGAVVLPDVTADDCSTNILVTNNSPYADVGGANGSGLYPEGTTVVTFFANDRCGNVSTCDVEITVEDQAAPQAVCIVGLSVNLAMMNGEPMAMINAEAFNGSTIDNCTPANEIKLSLRRAGTGEPTTPQLTFTCADLGNQMIEFWAEDAAGNRGHCLTVIAVQDNNGVCPQAAGGMIAGEVTTEAGQFVEGVMVEVMTNDPVFSYTSNDGFFELLGVPFGNNYTVRPERDEDPLNGVSTLDLMLISRHILGVQPLNTPYKMIAADVNRSGSISTLDIIALRKMILGMENHLPNGNASWRFVDANHIFLNPNNPFATPIPEVVNINGFDQDHVDANFVAIKVGDVDLSASPNGFTDIDERDPEGIMMINVPDVSVNEGQAFTIPFTTTGLNDVLGYQFTLRFNREMLEYVELSTGPVPGMSSTNFNVQKTHDGWITTSWNQANEMPSDGQSELFAITFRARQAIESLQELLSFTSVPTAKEAYDMEGNIMDVGLHFGEAVSASGSVRVEGYELYQNRPNPFSTKTVIGFKLPIAGEAKVTVYDMAGKVLFHQEGYYGAGAHELIIKGDDLAASGLLYYQLQTADYAAIKKMILMN